MKVVFQNNTEKEFPDSTLIQFYLNYLYLTLTDSQVVLIPFSSILYLEFSLNSTLSNNYTDLKKIHG